MVDGGFITANETAAAAFAYEIFRALELYTAKEMAAWRDKFLQGMFGN